MGWLERCAVVRMVIMSLFWNQSGGGTMRSESALERFVTLPSSLSPHA